jgi:hypothetical protein
LGDVHHTGSASRVVDDHTQINELYVQTRAIPSACSVESTSAIEIGVPPVAGVAADTGGDAAAGGCLALLLGGAFLDEGVAACEVPDEELAASSDGWTGAPGAVISANDAGEFASLAGEAGVVAFIPEKIRFVPFADAFLGCGAHAQSVTV